MRKAHRRHKRHKKSERAFVPQAARAQRISVAKLGGLPYISKPIRNTFAVNHKAAKTDATPMAIDSHTCHKGGGALEDIRRSIANVFTGGKKLMAVLKVELGSREIGTWRTHGSTRIIMIGII